MPAFTPWDPVNVRDWVVVTPPVASVRVPVTVDAVDETHSMVYTLSWHTHTHTHTHIYRHTLAW